MQTVKEEAAKTPELVPLNVIRVETALSRYPVHRLSKQGTIDIEIREQSEDGEVSIRWEVSHNSRHGQPGPLAYRLDTLIVNRRIEEASRPIPRIIKLGSLREIAGEVGVGDGNTTWVKRALRQNAFTGITAKICYKLNDKSERTLEADFTRYAVIFTGERLPDGRTADAVYLVLNDIFMRVINGAQTRPLDYDYLRDLPAASQRLYELLSFQMYATLKYGRKDARLSYGEFCTHAPLTRHLEWLRVRTQMNKLHAPHKKSSYIESVEFEQTTDRDGKPDWLMAYVPGPKAKAEFRAFNKRGGPRVLEIEQAPPALASPAEPEPNPLEQELISRGVTASTARELVAAYPEERITAQVEHFDWVREKHPKKLKQNPSGYLASAIRGDYAPLQGFETKAEREDRGRAERERQERELEAKRQQQTERNREKELEQQVTQMWEVLTEEEQQQLEAQSLAEADPESRRLYERAPTGNIRRAALRVIRETHLRKLIDAQVDGERNSQG